MGKGAGLGPAPTTVPTWVIASTAAATASRATLVRIAPRKYVPVNVPATENALALRVNVTKDFLATTARLKIARTTAPVTAGAARTAVVSASTATSETTVGSEHVQMTALAGDYASTGPACATRDTQATTVR